MDAKNDDSAGSDSLDKSLQKKCVVDDVGQGEGSTPIATLAQGISDRNEKNKSDTESEIRPANSIISKNKTEKSAGDGDSGGGGGVEINCRVGGTHGGINNTMDIINETLREDGDLNNTRNIANVNNNLGEPNSCTRNYDNTAISNNIVHDVIEAPSEISVNSNNSANSNSNCDSNNSNAFETKVKQISKNLKETTLAECANKKASVEDTNSTSSASSASSASSTPECEQATVDAATAALYSLGPSTSAAAAAAAAVAANVQDEHDHRSKKVRFHPDVKENDGGNRVIPKKKKKLKATQAGINSTSGGTTSYSGSGGGTDEVSGGSLRSTTAEDDMELDEEDDAEEEGTFSIAKTIEDAQDYLKEHPLTFAGSFDKSNATTQSGLLEEEDLPQLMESSDDSEEDFYGQVSPENGVERILGKQNKCGKVEFLLRYVDRSGLFWESEEFIGKRCPNLLNQYEHCRERRQGRLMNFVAKRQNLRQRYTDF